MLLGAVFLTQGMGCAVSQRQAAATDPFIELMYSGTATVNSAPQQAATDDPFIALMYSGMSAGSQEAAGDFDDEYDDYQMVPDPLKYWNLVWFYFNDGLYRAFFRPVGIAYNYVVPEPARKGVDNVFYNIKFPIRFVNNLLQGKLLAAGVEFSRFFGNTLFGGLGLMDITEHKKAAAPTPPEDFGQTLGSWGMGEGFYLVWPVLGPSSARDTLGLGVDYFLDPVNYIDPLWFVGYETDWWIPVVIDGTEGITSTAGKIEAIDMLYKSAVDPYAALRNAYIQRRAKQVAE
jgi:phospholipid-binding lipoprotein MlaA